MVKACMARYAGKTNLQMQAVFNQVSEFLIDKIRDELIAEFVANGEVSDARIRAMVCRALGVAA